jgi:hypothetical protein
VIEGSRPYDVVILGAGYAGLITVLRLGRQELGLRVALVNPRAEFLERVRLQESVVGPVKPRIPSISAFFAGTTIDFICGGVTSLERRFPRSFLLPGRQGVSWREANQAVRDQAPRRNSTEPHFDGEVAPVKRRVV